MLAILLQRSYCGDPTAAILLRRSYCGDPTAAILLGDPTAAILLRRSYCSDPTAAQDAITKNYLDTVDGGVQTFWLAYGTSFPAITNTEIGLFNLPANKTLANGKIAILRFWVQREVNTWFDSDCGGFKNSWPHFRLYVNSSNVLCISFTVLPTTSPSWSRNWTVHYIEFN